jgi:hypothetical protein
VFASDGDLEIFVMNIDSTGVQQLTNNTGVDDVIRRGETI